jgi:tetratricopeptide (TPR) repeat protein
MELGRHAEALADFERVAALSPGNTDADYQRGAQLLRLHRPAEALTAVNEFLLLAPDNTSALLIRGAALEELGRDEDALEDFNEVISREPGHPVPYYNRATMLDKLGRRQEALDAYDQAIARAPGEASFHVKKAVVLAGAGDLDSALAEFDTGCGLRPEAAGEAQAWAGAILWHRGEAQAARERFAQVRGHLTGTAARDAAQLEAIARCALGDPSGAERALEAFTAAQKPGHNNKELTALYDLLADPRLPGVDRLRAITGTDR